MIGGATFPAKEFQGSQYVTMSGYSSNERKSEHKKFQRYLRV